MMKRSFAAFTITRNEPLFLRVWLNYYASVFPPEDVYVIDNSTTDGSVKEARTLHPRVNFTSKASPQAHHSMFLKQAVEETQASLLRSYDVVVFAETDEFLIPSSKYSGLLDYCQQFQKSNDPRRRAVGWNVVQQSDEQALVREPGAALLQDRNAMWRLPSYDKTLITKQPLTYQKGFHNVYINGTKATDEPTDPDLALLHGWYLDVDEFYRRHGNRLQFKSRNEVVELFSNVDKQANSFGDPHAVGDRTLVPDHWRSLLTY